MTLDGKPNPQEQMKRKRNGLINNVTNSINIHLLFSMLLTTLQDT